MSGTQDRHFPLFLILWPLVCAALCTSAAFSSLGRPPSSVLHARDRRWQWWFTAPVLHAPFKTRGNQLLSDSQSQIPMRDKLRSQASISSLPLTARGTESPRTNLVPRPTSDEGGGTSQGLGVNGQVKHTFKVSPIHPLNAKGPAALVKYTETDKTKATSLSQ